MENTIRGWHCTSNIHAEAIKKNGFKRKTVYFSPYENTDRDFLYASWGIARVISNLLFYLTNSKDLDKYRQNKDKLDSEVDRLISGMSSGEIGMDIYVGGFTAAIPLDLKDKVNGAKLCVDVPTDLVVEHINGKFENGIFKGYEIEADLYEGKIPIQNTIEIKTVDVYENKHVGISSVTIQEILKNKTNFERSNGSKIRFLRYNAAKQLRLGKPYEK